MGGKQQGRKEQKMATRGHGGPKETYLLAYCGIGGWKGL